MAVISNSADVRASAEVPLYPFPLSAMGRCLAEVLSRLCRSLVFGVNPNAETNFPVMFHGGVPETFKSGGALQRLEAHQALTTLNVHVWRSGGKTSEPNDGAGTTSSGVVGYMREESGQWRV